jgi:hypothetical protein
MGTAVTDPALPATARRASRVAGLAAAVAATAYVALVDPSDGGVYPLCPTRLVLGLDCPACGGLRGTHDLLRGHLGDALDHNLLLPGFLGFVAVAFGLWLLPLAGRPAGVLRPPRWAAVAAIVTAVAFAVVRNLPVAGLEFLASDG